MTTRSGEISVGSTFSGRQRQITNVAAGTQTTDAANVGQVSAVKTVVDANAKATAAALGGGSTVGSDGKISAPSYKLGDETFTNVGGALGKLNDGMGEVVSGLGTMNETLQAAGESINGLDTRVTANKTAIDAAQTQLNTLDGLAAKYDDTTKATMTLGGGENGTKLTNLQDATLSATSTDAVTGRQLNATNTRMTTAEGNIDTLKTRLSSISGGTAGLVQQDATTKNLSVGKDTGGTEVSFAGKDADNNATKRKLTDIADGTNANDAVNFGQLSSVKTTVDQNTADIATNKTNIAATAKATADSLGGGAAVNADGTFKAPSYTVGGQSFNNVGGALGNLDGRVTTNTSDIADIKSSMSSGGGGSDGLVQQDADTKDINVAKTKGGNKVNLAGTDGDRVLAGVADGAINATSNQAVNGKQLYSISSGVASALGGGAGINADGTFKAPLFNIGGAQLNNVGDALKNLDNRVANNTTDINTLKNSGGGGNGGGTIKNGVQYDSDTHDSLTLNSGGNAVSLKNVKNGTVAKDSTDAVNGGQLWDTNEAIKNLDQKVTNNQTTGNSNVSIKSTPGLKSASASGDGSVAMGGGSVASGKNSTALGQSSVASGENSVALGQGSVADEENTVSVGSDSQQRRITNVKAGQRSTDAVNMGQLNQLRNDMNGAINSVARAAYSGIASAMAMPNLTPSGPGKTIVAAGGANYKGYSAVAASATYRSRNGRLLVNGAVSVAQTGDAGFRAQVGYEF
ncbi:YadA-like family protein [Trinickia sp. YCB016]